MVNRHSHSAAQLIAYSEQVLTCLASGNVPTTHINKVREYIDAHFSRHNPSYNHDDRQAFDDYGAKLWNATTKYMRSSPSDVVKGLAPLLRALAFLLLDTGQPKVKPSQSPKKAFGIAVRILKAAVKAARTLLDGDQEYELCAHILSRAANADVVLDDVRKAVSIDSDLDFRPASYVQFEFTLLRTLLDHKRGHQGLAEMHLGRCAKYLEANLDPHSVEMYADLTFEIGRGLRKKHDWQAAIEWLEKCCKALEQIDGEAGPDIDELGTVAQHELVRSLLGRADQTDLARADSIADYLLLESTPTLATCVLKLDTLAIKQPFPTEDFHGAIKKATISAVMTDATFKIIMQYIHKLKEHSPQLACKTLDSLVHLRLLECGNLAWIEKTFVTRLWICSEHTQTTQELEAIGELLAQIHLELGQSFTGDATYAAQALIWKCVEAEIKAAHYDEASTWCQFALHPLFAAAGDQSKSKLTRKLISIALACNKYMDAKAALDTMPESGKRDLLTLYMGFKIGLLNGDNDLAAASLDNLASHGGQKCMEILHACVLEAQKSGSRQHAITCLQTILGRLDRNGPGEKQQLPLVIRCTVRILMTELDVPDLAEQVRVLEEIVQIMRIAVQNLSQYCGKDETTWMAKTSYNLALKYITVLDRTSITEGLLETCITFTQKMLDDVQESGGSAYRLAVCWFLSAAVVVVQARATDDVDHAKALYETVRQHNQHFLETLATCNEEKRHTLSFQRGEAAKFELEAIFRLEAWIDLSPALDAAIGTISNEAGELDTLADLIIVIHEQMIRAGVNKSYHEKIPNVLQSIVNQSWRRDRSNISKVAHWIRCIFRMTLPVNPLMAMQCLEQAGAIAARKPSAAAQSQGYPQTELEWLATTAYNYAVDLFCASEPVEYRRWAEAALNLVKSAVVDKAVYEHMQRSFVQLTQTQAGAKRP